jgi:transketolase
VNFVLGNALCVREGKDATLISTGGLLGVAVETAQRLSEKGVGTRVLSMHTLKPLDTQAVLAAARETPLILTIEEHSIIGGLGSAVAEVLAEAPGSGVAFKRIGLPSQFSPYIGSQDYLRQRHGLTAEAISEYAAGVLQLAVTS